ncbi:MAG: SOS response-associated peptidase [Pseudomonadales bacterium]
MCGRFNVEADPLSRLLMELVRLPHPGPDNHNAAPTEPVVVLRRGERGDPQLVPMRWWLTPSWAKEPGTRYSMFNARSEGVAQSRAFREPFRKRRCAVPVSGFYEWASAEPPRPGKRPFYLRPLEQSGLLIAGIWDCWRDPDDGSELLSFAILTTAAHPAIDFVHNRQPVMLSAVDAQCWLDPAMAGDDLQPLLAARLPVALEVVPVSTWVNNARHKGPRCMEAVGTPLAVAADAAAGAR